MDKMIDDAFFVKFKDNFDKRLVLQKEIYLLQTFGMDLGYRYNWYHRGPYCPDLASDAYDISDNIVEYRNLCTALELTPDAIRTINSYKGWLLQAKPNNVEFTSWVELLSSIHYLQHYSYMDSKDKRNIIRFILDKKCWYKEEQAAYAYDILHSIGLIENVQITNIH